MLRRMLLSASRSETVKDLAEHAPISRGIVRRFVAGESAGDAIRVVERLASQGLYVSVDHLGEDVRDPRGAEAARDAYLGVLRRLDENALAASAEISVKLSALGVGLPQGGARIALDHAHALCEAAAAVGTTVTIDMEDHTTTDTTLDIVHTLRAAGFADVGAVLQAYLRRTEADCRDLAHEGSRVRLCKGAYDEPESVAFRTRADIDRSYARCLRTLMAGAGYPMVATHDPRLITLADMLARRVGRAADSFEYQMLHGVRPAEQVRLARQGDRVRVYVPYGDQWYGYLVRRLAERPANMAFFLRTLTSKR